MNHITPGIINNIVRQPPHRPPDAERSDRVRERRPHRNEQHPGVKVHPPEDGAPEKYDRDSRESELVEHVVRFRDVVGERVKELCQKIGLISGHVGLAEYADHG